MLKHYFLSIPTFMTTNRLLVIAAGFALSLLAACGGGDGVKLGEFPAITKTEGDEPFKLTAPSSKSPGAFTYSSSDQSVARIVGDMVTVGVAGTATITARQGQTGSYNPTSTTTLLTVKPRTCATPAVRENGLCVPPATTAGVVARNGISWMPTSFKLTWAEADAFCKNITYQGKTGWALPDRSQLKELASSGALSGQGWAFGDTWSATAESDKNHTAVELPTGSFSSLMNDNKIYVTCALSQ
jgi:hypothetical protein